MEGRSSNDEARRHALAEFLRTRRARVSPADVGLPTGGRRRVSGLRREEVAHLASVGTSWYTALEQGRDIHPSEQVVESLARALRLKEEERRHLFLLARQHEPISIEPHDGEVSPGLLQLVHNLDPHPAYLMGRRWDLLAWNRAAALVFDFNDPAPPYPRNLLWRIITHPAIRKRSHNWEYVARSSVAQFRADSARYPGDPLFVELLDDLRRACPEFGLWWSRHDVYGSPGGHERMVHPTLGDLEFERLMLQPPDRPDLKLVIFSATPTTAAVLSWDLGSQTRPA
jgi:hypothetical protein